MGPTSKRYSFLGGTRPSSVVTGEIPRRPDYAHPTPSSQVWNPSESDNLLCSRTKVRDGEEVDIGTLTTLKWTSVERLLREVLSSRTNPRTTSSRRGSRVGTGLTDEEQGS